MYYNRYIADLRRPASRLEIATMVLCGLSFFFLLVYGLGLVVTIPMRNGDPESFALISLALLFAAMPCMLVVRWQGLRREKLRCDGWPVQAKVVGARCHRSVSYGSAGGRKRHPWTVLCAYQYEGQTFTVRSTFLWDEPVGNTAKVFLDQLHPGRAWVDPKSLQYKIILR